MEKSDRPNIVMVVMDTTRAQSISCYGHDRETTPFLDELAENNIKYEDAVVQENWTLPSHASMFSGKYASEHGVTGSKSYSDIDPFMDDLSEKGYTTVGLANVAYLSPEFGADEMFDDFEYVPGKSFFNGLEMERDDFHSAEGSRKYLDLLGQIVGSGQVGKLFTGARKFFEKELLLRDSGARKTNRKVGEKLEDAEEPFFLFLNYVEPHYPYLPPFPYSHSFLDLKASPGKIKEKGSQDLGRYSVGENEPSEEELEFLKKIYDSEIKYLDSRLKKLYEYLKERYPDTVFIFTSDHGEQFSENGLFVHKTGGFYREVKEVPLIEVFPEEQSEEVSEPVEIKALAEHVPKLADRDFQSIEAGEPALSEDIGPEEEKVDEPNIVRQDYGFYGVSVQDEGYKFIWYSSGRKELYSMPEEEKVEDKQKSEELEQVVLDRVGNPEENDYRRETVEPEDEEIKERLEELGYM